VRVVLCKSFRVGFVWYKCSMALIGEVHKGYCAT
jgi:hypothetical protein